MDRFDVKIGYYSKGYKMELSENGEYCKYSDVKRVVFNEQQRKDFTEAAKPLMRFLNNPKIFHPHFTVILDSMSAELVEGCAMVRGASIFYRCKCGEEIEGNENTDINLIVCPKCKRTGCVEKLQF